MNVLEVYKFVTCGKKVRIPNFFAYYVPTVVSKHKRDFLIIFLLIKVSGHGLGFALLLANYCFMAHTGRPRL
jgi:hypothetical protein